jgi:hypothetical protein
MNAIALSISNIPVRQDAFGRFSLNDLHKAAGGESKHKPDNWLRLDSTQEVIAELDQFSDLRSVDVIRGGKNPGTFGVKEIMYSYAMWISAKFHIAVIRAYDSLVTGSRYGLLELPEPPTITNAQAGQLYCTVDGIAGDDNKIRAAIWKRFQLHFDINSYKLLPADKFDDAVEYLEQKRIEYRDGATMLYISDKELEARIEEKLKAMEGELLDKATGNTLNIDLDLPEGLKQMTLSFNSNPVLGGRWVLWHSGDRLTIRPMSQDEFSTTSENLAKIVGDSMGGAVKRQHLAEIIEAAARRMK